MSTKSNDWKVTDIVRTDACFSAPAGGIEFISFKLSYQGSEPEQLTDIPFLAGITEDDLVRWCVDSAIYRQGAIG
jgi:hypothetical protein